MAKHNEKPLDDTVRPVPARKNTKRWCKGKVGREHKPALRVTQWLSRAYTCGWVVNSWRAALRGGGSKPFWECYHEEYCTVCGKIVQHWLSDKKTCPDYTEDQTHLSQMVKSSLQAPH